ncbi:hypothetical protein JQN70_16210 [Phycicoccus sp. MQZ13P-5]|uniref:Uncharacterized protein n=1 Tax=Phycicoccus sonneratiae TaxID=2807628 RepID=A0ABS2CPX4_9MICO|nr:hypothetical protein [Phycicoccus sonneraticus]
MGCDVLRVTLRGGGLPTVVLGTGETLWFGRAPHRALDDLDADHQLRATALALPLCAPHVSRVLGALEVGEEIVRLRWRGSTEAQLSSLFDAPGGARRVTVTEGMSALLDEGENALVVLRGRERETGVFDDLQVVLDVASQDPEPVGAPPERALPGEDGATAPAPRLEAQTREWFVALALAEPWLSGTDDYPRPPSNREIYERVLGWHGYAWNLDRSQRVDDSIRSISRLAFGPDDPFLQGGGRAQNVRFAIGRRAAEVRLVTVEDLERVEAAARNRNLPPS